MYELHNNITYAIRESGTVSDLFLHARVFFCFVFLLQIVAKGLYNDGLFRRSGPRPNPIQNSFKDKHRVIVRNQKNILRPQFFFFFILS